jgi:hypothetical protein
MAQVGDGIVAVPSGRTQEQLGWLTEEIAEPVGQPVVAFPAAGFEQRRLVADLCRARDADHNAIRLRAEGSRDLLAEEMVGILRSFAVRAAPDAAAELLRRRELRRMLR